MFVVFRGINIVISIPSSPCKILTFMYNELKHFFIQDFALLA